MTTPAFGICPAHMLININKMPVRSRALCCPLTRTGTHTRTRFSCSRHSLCALWKWRLISTGVCAYGTRVDCCPCGNQVKCQSARTHWVSSRERESWQLCRGRLETGDLLRFRPESNFHYPILMLWGAHDLSGRSPMLCYANLGKKKVSISYLVKPKVHLLLPPLATPLSIPHPSQLTFYSPESCVVLWPKTL